MKNFFFMRMYECQVMTSTMMRDLPRLRDSDAISRDTSASGASNGVNRGGPQWARGGSASVHIIFFIN
jgi:hypothetical protein